MTLRIGIVGAGAIGGFFAAHLGQAGAEIRLLARGATLAALREKGVQLEHDGGRIHMEPTVVSDDPAQLGPVDILMITVKGQDTAAAIANLDPMIGPETRLLSLQNGLAGLEVMADTYGADRVFSGITYVPAGVTEPGQVRHTGAVTRTLFGPYVAGAAHPNGPRLAELGAAAGLDMSYLEEPLPEIWAKFVMLAPFHIVCALTRAPLGAWIDCSETREVYRAAMAEVAALARARGVDLPADIVDRHLAFSVSQADRRTRASMLDDLERGRATELEATVGWLVREARRLSVPVPVHDMGYALLKPLSAGRPPAGSAA
ncbi:hypothetical protein BOO69_02350 [Sulfitobacter alexandrii]|uniref:2-dehydropantoate 2-reductase n=1 Tax=Sulfitobacter alexandrii TaxID=1917485 RepID=A0A1J0WDI5_9RHOB|nr:2-dehydropantoate 2-reductase [Sulfitobacter alexandrii]APE42383.1 hypothetical protein BOO69_02350 [Sulfitobacter alexandrii]